MRVLEEPITKQELVHQSKNFIDENAIKAVVDVDKEIIAVDSPMHYDCEQLLLENGSKQSGLWGINLYLDCEDVNDIVEFDSMINVRPVDGNRSRGVENLEVQEKIKRIVKKWIK